MVRGIFFWPLVVCGGVLGVLSYQEGALLWSAFRFMGGAFLLQSLVFALALIPRYVNIDHDDRVLCIRKPYAFFRSDTLIDLALLDQVQNVGHAPEKTYLLFEGRNQQRRKVNIIPFSPREKASFAALLRSHSIRTIGF